MINIILINRNRILKAKAFNLIAHSVALALSHIEQLMARLMY